MGQVHVKGRILQLVAEKSELWDYEICDLIMKEYKMNGDYWKGVVRIDLIDLLSGALLESIEEKIDEDEYFGSEKLAFKYKLTDFGRLRMIDTGLLR